ncbi:hypothetical protein SAMN05661091_0674 [Paenibacillus uliginis N3/975]|uniref:Organic solvent tolerance-like N-terminal domain-containing protein n=1 Tax=Paenibacillus uliginis N3/975 TaxID=1313296 RepID=A0A1X7GK94_9BACL|nr:hypothetical protein [Paenibacillus uliginis]SMF70940.1 hypothetical protein SAMN05661091_0674 [Paenibacillus uliginis N3/975]
MLNVVLLLMGMLSPFSDGAGALPVSAAGITAPVVHASMSFDSTVSVQQKEVIEGYETLNGIDLTDRTEDVVRKMGEPLEVTHDPLLGMIEYHYKDMSVGFCDGLTEYVHVKPSARSIQVNDQSILLTTGHISTSLGDPDFKAEDGDVYVQDHQVIKVFKDRSSGEITGVDLFFDYSE